MVYWLIFQIEKFSLKEEIQNLMKANKKMISLYKKDYFMTKMSICFIRLLSIQDLNIENKEKTIY